MNHARERKISIKQRKSRASTCGLLILRVSQPTSRNKSPWTWISHLLWNDRASCSHPLFWQQCLILLFLAVSQQLTSNPLKPAINRVAFQSEGEARWRLSSCYLQSGWSIAMIVTDNCKKEQMPAVCSAAWSRFAFDFRYWGESGGTPSVRISLPRQKYRTSQERRFAFLKSLAAGW